MLGQNLYFYYGNQPLLVMKWPLYQGAGNAVAVMLGTTVLFFLQPLLNKQSWRWIPAAIVLLPFCGVMGWSAVGIPCFYAVHSQWPNWAVQAAGIATFALASMVIYAIAALVSVDSPMHDRMQKIGFFSDRR
jgi:hypothetical protein